MATTKRERKIEVKEPEKKEYLEHDHLKNLEVISRDVENAKLSMAVEEQSLANMELEKKLLDVKIEKQKILVASKAQRYETMKQKYVSYKKEIWPLYGLKENEPMGYDPLSGRIVVN